MPVHQKTFLFTVAIGLIGFWIAGRLGDKELPAAELGRWRKLWLGVIAVAFFAPNIWLFFAGVGIVLLLFIPAAPEQRVLGYLLLLCALPNVHAEIPGFGGIRFLFDLSQARLLTLMLLMPLFLQSRRWLSSDDRLFRYPSDKYVLAYVVVTSLLEFRGNTFTNGLRFAFLQFLDIHVPYFVLSRHLGTSVSFRRSLLAMLVGLLIEALIGVFETVKRWHLFAIVLHRLHSGRGSYDIRAGLLRATGAFGSPIFLGYASGIALGIQAYLHPRIRENAIVTLVYGVLLLGLLVTLARGPWVGFVFFVLAFIWTGKARFKRYIGLAMLGMALLAALSVTPAGQRFIDLLPVVGTVRSDTIDYRKRLFEKAVILFERKPLFGDPHYRDTPEMESMRQGQGIIDVVNSYVHIGLAYGLVGLAIFAALFASLLLNLRRVIERLPNQSGEDRLLGRVLFALLAYTALVIATSSSIDYVPVLYWTLIAFATAYVQRMGHDGGQTVEHETQTRNQRRPHPALDPELWPEKPGKDARVEP